MAGGLRRMREKRREERESDKKEAAKAAADVATKFEKASDKTGDKVGEKAKRLPTPRTGFDKPRVAVRPGEGAPLAGSSDGDSERTVVPAPPVTH